jgi:Ser/Thr protein kinase RdoA (MazF antagonist)
MKQSMWGKDTTEHFYNLDPMAILKAIDAVGFKTTGRILALNSLENRVYEVEIEKKLQEILSPSDKFIIAKFYRPGRWSKEQILQEHEYLQDLAEAEIPAIAPLYYQGSTLHELTFEEGQTPIYYTLFPKQGGRMNDELNELQLQQLGRLLARIHSVGAQKKATKRLVLTPATYGAANLDYLLSGGLIPKNLEQPYSQVVNAICQYTEKLYTDLDVMNHLQRIHGDCHLGNILWKDELAFLVDFDDMVMGPRVQDLWLMTPGEAHEVGWQRDLILDGYESMSSFPYEQLKLIEPLRALRFILFSSWIARRQSDASFSRAFPQYGTMNYWQEQIADLNHQLEIF